jgi:predicted nucleic acid-binding protein
VNGYLLDTSVIARLHKPPVAERLAALGGADLRICVPVLLEIGVGARNAEHHRELLDDLRTAYPLLTASPWAQERAAEVQELLAASGAHRSARLGDLLVAATAEQAGLTVLHYDGDFEQVTRATGQPTEWVVPPGQADLPGPGQADYERWAAFVDGPTPPEVAPGARVRTSGRG